MRVCKDPPEQGVSTDSEKANQVFNEVAVVALQNLPDATSSWLCVLGFLLGAKPPSPGPTLEASVQNVELKICSRATLHCASGTVGAVKVCARTPGVCSCALLNFTACVGGERGRGREREPVWTPLSSRLHTFARSLSLALCHCFSPLLSLSLSFCLSLSPHSLPPNCCLFFSLSPFMSSPSLQMWYCVTAILFGAVVELWPAI